MGMVLIVKGYLNKTMIVTASSASLIHQILSN